MYSSFHPCINLKSYLYSSWYHSTIDALFSCEQQDISNITFCVQMVTTYFSTGGLCAFLSRAWITVSAFLQQCAEVLLILEVNGSKWILFCKYCFNLKFSLRWVNISLLDRIIQVCSCPWCLSQLQDLLVLGNSLNNFSVWRLSIIPCMHVNV